MAEIAARLLRATRGMGFRALGLALLLLATPALATDPQFGAIRIEASPNIRHAFVSTQPQSSNSNIVSKNEWNAAHTAPTQLVASVPTGMVWPAMPAAVTEFCGASTHYRWRADLTNQTSIRLTAQIVTAGAATSALRLQYTTDTSGASGWDYLDGVSGPSVSISSSGVTTSATVALVTAAKAEVLLRLVGINGDGVGGQACYSAITAGAVAALAANGANCSAGSFPLGVDASGAAESCTALPTTITGTANQITASAATGAIVLSIPTNPTLPGTTSGTFSGSLGGNASTSSALAADGANCSAGSAPLGVDAAGAVQGCFAVPSGTGTVSGTNTGDQTSVSGNAGTATALAANGANCSAGEFPLGVDASGAVESCTALPTTITGTANQITASAVTGAIVLSIPTNPTLPGTTSGTFSGALTGAVTGNASTSTALAANPTNCSPGEFPAGVDAAGAAEGCTAISTTLSTSTSTSGLSASLLATNGTTLVQGPTYASGVFTQAIRFGDSSLGSAIVPLASRLGTAATANVFEMQNAAGTNLAYFKANGGLYLPIGSSGTGLSLTLGNYSNRGFYDDGSGAWTYQASGVNVFQIVGQSTLHLLNTGTIGWDTGAGTGYGIRGTLSSESGGVYQWGLDTGSAATRQKLKAHDGVGTNIAGAGFDLATGVGSGNATPDSIALQTSIPVASGATAQALGDRLEILGKYTALAEATATSFARTAIASGAVAGGAVTVTVEANDATDYQSRTLTYTWSASNKAGTIAFGLSTPSEGVGPSTGTLTCTITLVDAGSGNLDHKADCTSSLAQTVLRANAQVARNFAGAITEQ